MKHLIWKYFTTDLLTTVTVYIHASVTQTYSEQFYNWQISHNTKLMTSAISPVFRYLGQHRIDREGS